MDRRVILFLTFASCTLAAIDTSCKQGGEYCLNHWDCCSNTCLSFLYKCSNIPSSSAAVASDFAPLQLQAQSSPALFAPAAIPTKSPDTMSFEALLEFIFSPLKSEPIAAGREVNSIKPRLGESADEEDEDELRKVDDVIINTTTTETVTDGPQCLEIGAKCYFNDDCCSKRCHGYLHQCVT